MPCAASNRGLPILVVSGGGIEAWLAMGPLARVDFCAKPFTLQEVGRKIRVLLDDEVRPPHP